jgi:hypothetical protein
MLARSEGWPSVELPSRNERLKELMMFGRVARRR